MITNYDKENLQEMERKGNLRNRRSLWEWNFSYFSRIKRKIVGSRNVLPSTSTVLPYYKFQRNTKFNEDYDKFSYSSLPSPKTSLPTLHNILPPFPSFKSRLNQGTGWGAGRATVRTGYGTTDWFKIGKGVRQGCMLSPCLFNLSAEYIMWKTGLEESQNGIKIAGRNINNLRYADDSTLVAESEEELKNLLMRVKEESTKMFWNST